MAEATESHSKFATTLTVSRAQLMTRAWQLARLNWGSPKISVTANFGHWLAYAWKEAREGRTENWSFLSSEHEARSLEHQLVIIERDDRRTPQHYRLMAQLRASIHALRGSAAHV